MRGAIGGPPTALRGEFMGRDHAICTARPVGLPLSQRYSICAMAD
jgi:hypothetical protein